MNYHIKYSGDNFGINGGNPRKQPAAYQQYTMPPYASNPSPPRPSYGGDGENPNNVRCKICPSPAEIFCTRCKGTGYCSQLHLVEDEGSHRNICNPLRNFTELSRSSDKREPRWMVSTSSVPAGETVAKIHPHMMAPHDKNLPGPPHSSLCFGCCRWFPTEFYKCSACHWPACSINCANNSLHTAYECQLFRKFGRVSPEAFPGIYDAVLTTRVLLLLDKGSHRDSLKASYQDWIIFQNHPGNASKMRLSAPEEMHQIIQDFILKKCRYQPRDEKLVPSEHVRRVTDFVICNSICQENPATACDCRVDSVRIRNYHSAKYFFPYLHAYSHSCNPNTSWTINHAMNLRDASLHLWAAVPIKHGIKITVAFDETFSEYGTLERRKLQLVNFDRNCDCDRCSDPTELNSMASALLCKNCGSGHILPTSPLDPESPWVCKTPDCQTEIKVPDVLQTFHRITEEIRQSSSSIRELQRIIKRNRSELHPRHYLIARAADRITQLGWIFVKNQTLPELATYNFKPCAKAAKICLDFANHVSPGYTKHRARYMFLLQVLHGITATFNAMYHFRNCEFVEARLIRKKCERIYLYQLEFCKILQYEKIGSPLHNWLTILEKSKDDLGELLRTTSRRRGFDYCELERLKKAFSYFTSQVYTPIVPKDMQVDVSHIVIYDATPFRPEYKVFFEFQENR